MKRHFWNKNLLFPNRNRILLQSFRNTYHTHCIWYKVWRVYSCSSICYNQETIVFDSIKKQFHLECLENGSAAGPTYWRRVTFYLDWDKLMFVGDRGEHSFPAANSGTIIELSLKPWKRIMWVCCLQRKARYMEKLAPDLWGCDLHPVILSADFCLSNSAGSLLRFMHGQHVPHAGPLALSVSHSLRL